MKFLLKRLRSDEAFMGPTHALSAVATFLVLIAFIPAFTDFLKFDNLSIFVLTGLTLVGAALIPDLDNTQSTIKNSLGPLGSILSSIFRVSSLTIQTTIRSKRDSADPDPHRGFWHTIFASLMLGVVIVMGTKIGGSVTLPLLGMVSFGYIIALIISFILIHLALTTILNIAVKNLGKSTSAQIGSLLFSLITTVFLFSQLPKAVDFVWLGFATSLGMIIHILGDTVTTSGTPLLWPIPIKGKLWWNVRFTSMKAGGDFEKVFLLPAFGIISVIALSMIIKNGVFS